MKNLIDQCEYIDAHTHLDFYTDNKDKNRVLKEIEYHKILSLNNSMDEISYQLNQDFSKKSKYVSPCFGVHPWRVKNISPDWNQYEKNIVNNMMIGEIGLDFHWVEDRSSYQAQIEIFTRFLNLAQKYYKPINIHTKGAEMEVLNILKEKHDLKVLIHWYSGPAALIDQFLDLGCFFTMSVDILSSKDAKRICELLPVERILPETDNPEGYSWIYGRKGYPADIKVVYEGIGKIKNLDQVSMKKVMKDNLMDLFKVKHCL